MSFPFTILGHYLGGSNRPDHFDLLFGTAVGPLATWQLTRTPSSAGWCPARQLPPHRVRYLRYEGPVLGNGWVAQRDTGRCRVLVDHPDLFRALVFDCWQPGIWSLERVDEDSWRGQFKAAYSSLPLDDAC